MTTYRGFVLVGLDYHPSARNAECSVVRCAHDHQFIGGAQGALVCALNLLSGHESGLGHAVGVIRSDGELMNADECRCVQENLADIIAD